MLHERYAAALQQQFQEAGTALIVLCDGQIIYSSTDRYDFHADEVVLQTEQARNKPCFIFTSSPLIEEIAAWADLGKGDHYPTIELFLGARGWNESYVFNHGVSVVSDFDTGNGAMAIFDETLCYQLSGDQRPLRQAIHLGRLYDYRPRLMRVGIQDRKQRRVIERVVEAVENWSDPTQNPFKLINPKRQGLVGRDLMFQLFFQITLNPQTCQSEWSLI